ncbi:GTPase [Clostridium sp. AM54-37XD]|nr:GTPase [Clostridium sp. AM54-37XD]
MSKPIVAIVGRPNVGKSTCSMHWQERKFQL